MYEKKPSERGPRVLPGTQLALPVSLEDSAAFDNYVAGRNAVAVTTLRDVIDNAKSGHVVYLWGESGVGKTHLLWAACRRAAQLGLGYNYFAGTVGSLATHRDGSDSGVVAIDDVGQLAGDNAAERALMQLYERRHRNVTRIIVSGRVPPAQLGLALADVATRLGAEFVFRLHGLSDTDKAHAMMLRAARRGFQLDPDVVQYLLGRVPRDNDTMFRLLDAIDERSLQKQRRITIPLVKDLLSAFDAVDRGQERS